MFAGELRTIDQARAVRDGGDEFLVIGAPGRTGLARDLTAFLPAWQATFRAGFGVPAGVVPRIVVGG